jgi:4-amino-4-deoxy-L-arabinose transferase-like glycosyltransferase
MSSLAAQQATDAYALNDLARPDPLRAPQPRTGWLLAALFVLCLVPRLLMAWQISVMSTDGAFFISLAQRIERGVQQVETQYDLNIYPLVLSWLHRVGLDWETAGELWGVLCGSLAVLPLFGWARRQFGQRVAVTACLLYAVHPKLIEWTPEILRESTFWLLLATYVYCLYRAVTEVRLRFFVACGVLWSLAVNTRFEAWFLLLPAVLWTLWRWFALQQAKARLLLGMALLVACYPLVMLLLLRAAGYDGWEWGTFQRLHLVARWLQSFHDESDDEPSPPSRRPATRRQPTAPGDSAGGASQPPPRDDASQPDPREAAVPSPTCTHEPLPLAATPPTARRARWVAPVDRLSFPALLWIYVHTLERGFTFVYGPLLLWGLAAHWRLWLRRDMQPLFYWCLLVLGGMWIHLWNSNETSSRYCMSLVMLGSPLAALGLVALCATLARWLARDLPEVRPAIQQRLLPALLGVLAIVGWTDALWSGFDGRQARADLGRWLRAELGPGAKVAGTAKWSLLNYYAQGTFVRFPLDLHDAQPVDLVEWIGEVQPQAVVLCQRRFSTAEIHEVLVEAPRLGLHLVNPQELPLSCQAEAVVLLRHEVRDHLVRRPRP